MYPTIYLPIQNSRHTQSKPLSGSAASWPSCLAQVSVGRRLAIKCMHCRAWPSIPMRWVERCMKLNVTTHRVFWRSRRQLGVSSHVWLCIADATWFDSGITQHTRFTTPPQFGLLARNIRARRFINTQRRRRCNGRRPLAMDARARLLPSVLQRADEGSTGAEAAVCQRRLARGDIVFVL